MSSSSHAPHRPYLLFRGVENNDKAFLPLNLDLREIRCVILFPGSGDDPVECELVYTNIEEGSDARIPYVALSYCWGDLEDPAEILLHSPSATGERTSAPFRVTRNLHIALQAIRNETRQYLWIDALCINQQDPREKTHQVQLMGKIYSSAESVLAWLGQDDTYSRFFSRAWTTHIRPATEGHRPAEMLVLWNKLFKDTNPIWRNMARDKVLSQLGFKLNHEKLDNSSPDLCRKAIHIGFSSLFTRPWWSRIWVLQEVLLAPRQERYGRKVEFRVGNTRLRWFDMLLPKSYYHMNRMSLDVKSAMAHHKIQWAWETLMNKYGMNSDFYLGRLFTKTQEFQASDPRDRLFALLSLAKDTKDCFWKEALISPDYTKSTNTVYDDLVSWKPEFGPWRRDYWGRTVPGQPSPRPSPKSIVATRRRRACSFVNWILVEVKQSFKKQCI